MGEIILLRHSVTAGNREGRYLGCRTDEPLCQEGIDLLMGRKYPDVDAVYASPMKRCVETARLIWKEQAENLILVPGFRECDFGDFENRNYQELNGNPDYQAWIDSGGTMPFPGGESMEVFRRRCRESFVRIAGTIRESRTCAAMVVHGGTIMAILEQYGTPKKDYFDYQVKNGCGYVLTPAEGAGLWNYQCLP